MTTLKIAHVVRRFAFDEWGGTESVVWNTALQQSAMGLVPEILTTAALATTGEELRQGIRICRFPYWYPYFPMTDATRIALDKKGKSIIIVGNGVICVNRERLAAQFVAGGIFAAPQLD